MHCKQPLTLREFSEHVEKKHTLENICAVGLTEDTQVTDLLNIYINYEPDTTVSLG